MSTVEVLEPVAAEDSALMTIEQLKRQLATYLKPRQVQAVVRAHKFAERAHEGQWRQTGDPYITHPLAVASILADMHLDHECLMAALLHDVIEDTGVAKEELGERFGKVVVEIVDGVSKLKMLPVTSHREAQAINLQKMVQAMGRDIRVVLVKLADRLHNMRTLQVLDPEKRRRIAKETLEIYAPMALRLGMNTLRVELEELGFRGMHPLRSRLIASAAEQVHVGREALVREIGDKLRGALEEYRVSAVVIPHQRHLYSIYHKMRTENRSFRDIMDRQGFRILVKDTRDCYAALGAVHMQYTPVNGSFSDYITACKANGYQSLHTTLLDEHGLSIELQIRTEQMEEAANYGVASQWLDRAADSRATQWIRDQVELLEQTENSMEFVEDLKADMAPGRVYVHTRTGSTLSLPVGATPVDFAYALHRDTGNTCVSCRINHRLASLSSPLRSGQTVEIITAVDARPKEEWLNFVVTPRARRGISDALRLQKSSASIALGRRWLEDSLRRHHASLDDLHPGILKKTLQQEGLQEPDQLFEKIGLGQLLSPFVAAQLLGLDDNALRTGASPLPLAVSGTEQLAVSYASCCRPIPGDPIVGHAGRGQGIEVHVESCNRVLEIRNKNEEVISLRWEEKIQQEFAAELRAELARERDALPYLVDLVAREDVCLEGVNVVQQDAQLLVVSLVMLVRDRTHLASVIRRIRHLHGVSRVTRVGS